MSACWNWFVNKVNYFFDLSQIIANAKTAVVVRKRPNAAVAVKSDRFILKANLKNLNF